MPMEWYISRVCEEFQCSPAEALELDAELVDKILELRTFARMLSKDDKDKTKHELEVEGRIATELIRRKNRWYEVNVKKE